jgi:LysM repeat protein
MWTRSACVVLAWGILLILVAVGMKGPVRPAQANIRIAISTTHVTLTSTLSVAATSVKATNPAVRYVVQPGDTLSGIAAALAVRGGWPALYAANRRVVGADPNVIHPGTVLVLPGHATPVRYTVAAGDTLSGIAAALAVRGGWPALYAANRRVIGPDPNTIHPGTVLTVARPPAPASPSSGPGRRVRPAPPSAPAHTRHGAAPLRTSAPAPAGMPRWLATVLLAAGLLIGAAFLADLVLVAFRRYRRQQRHRPPATGRVRFTGWVSRVGHRPPATRREPFTGWGPDVGHRPPATRREPFTGWGPDVGHRPPATRRKPFTGWGPRIILADYDRLVVTHSKADDTVYVLRPPGEDPRAILRVARLVLKEDPYQELAAKLGVPASWPME